MDRAESPAPGRFSGGGIDLFCGGHASLADGRLLFASGTEKGVNGHRLCRIFDPHAYSDPSTHGWSNTDSLNVARWYPSLTTLGDGRVMAFSGLQYFELLTFGGALANGTAVDTLSPMVLERSPYWNAGDVPIPDVTLGSTRPSARTDAAIDASVAVRLVGNDASGVAMMYGGKDGSSPQGDLWVAWREGFHTREAWKWVEPPVDATRDPKCRARASGRHDACVRSESTVRAARLHRRCGEQSTSRDLAGRRQLRASR